VAKRRVPNTHDRGRRLICLNWAWLRSLVDSGGSDLLLVDDASAQILVAGNWRPLDGDTLHGEAILDAFDAVLTSEQRDAFARERDLDFAYQIDGLGRFRVNLHYQRGTPAAAVRSIPGAPPKLEDLGLPDAVQSLASFNSGLVLVTGGTGHGKSTTIAGLIEHINQKRRAHILTVEDPIEYLFTNGQSIIEQREVGEDTPAFASALRHDVDGHAIYISRGVGCERGQSPRIRFNCPPEITLLTIQ